MNEEPIIGIDFDDVIFDFNRSYVDHHNKKYGTDMTRDRIVNYALEKTWNMSMDEIFPRIEYFYKSDDHHTTAPVDGSKEVIRTLSEKYHLVVITSRPDSMKEATLKWLKDHLGDVIKDVYFTNQFMGKGSKTSKIDVCKKLGVRALIEDAPTYAREVSSEGIPVILLDTPWNQGVQGQNIHRVDSWNNVLNKIQEIL